MEQKNMCPKCGQAATARWHDTRTILSVFKSCGAYTSHIHYYCACGYKWF